MQTKTQAFDFKDFRFDYLQSEAPAESDRMLL